MKYVMLILNTEAAGKLTAEEYEAWLRRLREEAYVEYRLKGGGDATKTGADNTDGKKSS